MQINACVFDDKDTYNDGMFCNEYTFNCGENDDYSNFLNLLTICLKNRKYVVLFNEERNIK